MFSCQKNNLKQVLADCIYRKIEKGKTCKMDLPLLKNDITTLYEVARPLSNNLKGGYHISCPFGYVGRGRVRVVTHGLNLPRHGTETARRLCGFYPVRGAGQNRRP